MDSVDVLLTTACLFGAVMVVVIGIVIHDVTTDPRNTLMTRPFKPDQSTASDPIDTLTPEVAAEINKVLRAHATANPNAQNALLSGGIGTMIAGPLIKIVLAKVLPVLQRQALALLDAKVAEIQAAHPGLDLSFVHAIAVSVFGMLGGTASAAPGGLPAGLV